MISTSTTQPIPFTPSWREGADNPPTFLLRAGSVIERAQMEAELSGPYRAGRVYGYELRAAVRAGVIALLAGDTDLDRLLGLIEAEGEGETVAMTDDDTRLLAETRAVLAEHWPEYRDLVAQLERRREIAPIVALKRFCTGWDNCTNDRGKSVAFDRGRDGQVTDAALGGLDQLEMMSAGNRAYGLQYGFEPAAASADLEGNSPPPSASADGPATTNADAPSKVVGKSRAKRGPKILA